MAAEVIALDLRFLPRDARSWADSGSETNSMRSIVPPVQYGGSRRRPESSRMARSVVSHMMSPSPIQEESDVDSKPQTERLRSRETARSSHHAWKHGEILPPERAAAIRKEQDVLLHHLEQKYEEVRHWEEFHVQTENKSNHRKKDTARKLAVLQRERLTSRKMAEKEKEKQLRLERKRFQGEWKRRQFELEQLKVNKVKPPPKVTKRRTSHVQQKQKEKMLEKTKKMLEKEQKAEERRQCLALEKEQQQQQLANKTTQRFEQVLQRKAWVGETIEQKARLLERAQEKEDERVQALLAEKQKKLQRKAAKIERIRKKKEAQRKKVEEEEQQRALEKLEQNKEKAQHVLEEKERLLQIRFEERQIAENGVRQRHSQLKEQQEKEALALKHRLDQQQQEYVEQKRKEQENHAKRLEILRHEMLFRRAAVEALHGERNIAHSHAQDLLENVERLKALQKAAPETKKKMKKVQPLGKWQDIVVGRLAKKKKKKTIVTDVISKKACPCCGALFHPTSVSTMITRKAVWKQKVSDGGKPPQGKELLPTRLYESVFVCDGCAPLFEAKE